VQGSIKTQPRKKFLPIQLLMLVVILPLLSCEYKEIPIQSDLPEKENFHLFLLAGQSNMAGRGEVEAQDRELVERVYSFNEEQQWVYATDPIHFDKPVAGVGLGRTFGIEVASANPEITVGLIPAAVGGSPIRTWSPGVVHEQTGTTPYDDAIARAKVAMKDGELKAILWHQGESDDTLDRAEKYEEEFRVLIERFRKDLGKPDLLIIIGQLDQFPESTLGEGGRIVDQIQQKVAAEDENILFVNSNGLTAMEDNTHFDAESMREFGKRFAEVYLEFLK